MNNLIDAILNYAQSSSISTLVATIFSFLFLIALFLPMEKVFPAKSGQAFFRPDWKLDLWFFLGQYLLWSGIVTFILYHFSLWLEPHLPTEWRAMVKSQPFWLQVLAVVLLSDFFIYWAHRLQHKVDFLWRFHKVHHSAEYLDWLAAHREHPLDSIYTIGIINLPAILMGFELEAIGTFIAFRGLWAIYIHSNVRLPLGFLKKLIGSPELHHWHHDAERDRGNYANLSPIMDMLFGTYVCPDQEPERYGIKEPFPKTYWGQMIAPFRRRSDQT